LQPSRTVTLWFGSTKARITFVCQRSIGLGIIEESSFINIKYVLWLLCVDYFGPFSLFQSISVSRFTNALSPNTVLYTRFCHFLKRSIQPSEVWKLKIPRWAATCRAFSFRCGPSMDVFVVWACLNHVQRMVSGFSSGEVFRDFRK
jgi:hypothetical protein